jgi:hypothetical protein
MIGNGTRRAALATRPRGSRGPLVESPEALGGGPAGGGLESLSAHRREARTAVPTRTERPRRRLGRPLMHPRDVAPFPVICAEGVAPQPTGGATPESAATAPSPATGRSPRPFSRRFHARGPDVGRLSMVPLDGPLDPPARTRSMRGQGCGVDLLRDRSMRDRNRGAGDPGDESMCGWSLGATGRKGAIDAWPQSRGRGGRPVGGRATAGRSMGG